MTADDPTDVDVLARELHESMKHPLETGMFMKNIARPQIPFDDLSPEAREGRREMARFLLRRFEISPRSACR